MTAFFAARQQKEWTALKAALSPAMTAIFVKDYNDDQENLTDMLDTLNFWLPTGDATITGGRLTGDAAVLEVEASWRRASRPSRWSA